MKDTAVDMVVVEGEHHAHVLLAGEMDLLSAPSVRGHLLDLVSERPLVLDVAGVSFFDAEGLRTVAVTARRGLERGTGVALVGARPFPEKMFRILRMHEVVPLCSTAREALCCLLPRTDEEIADWLGH
ncbi:STAS domain-containing protein [Actinomadura viridis]|uniref:STAS domain-containing protein n=1 Tax=Actinomadura viridis TaxID=58110 RepID=UPI0036C19BAB